MVFMTWSSKTWSEENDCQDLVNQFPKSKYYFVQGLACQVLCNSMFPSLDNDCIWLHYSRLGFPSLESFWGKQFQKYLCLSWLGLPRLEHKWKWLSRVGMYSWRLGMSSVEMLLCFANPCSQVLAIISLLLGLQISKLDPYQIYVLPKWK